MGKNRKLYGYCAVTADFIHIGHLNLFKKCKTACKHLTVGVMSDDCVEAYKGKKSIMNESQRRDLVASISYVDNTIIQTTFEFPHAVLRLKWFYEDQYIIFDNEQHSRKWADILIPYMSGISSTRFKKEYMA